MKPKKPRPRKPRERPDLRRLAAPPPPGLDPLPGRELRRGNMVAARGRRVGGVTPPPICLDMGDTLVTLYGADLRIESFAGKRLIAAGRFARIELRSKWEVPQE